MLQQRFLLSQQPVLLFGGRSTVPPVLAKSIGASKRLSNASKDFGSFPQPGMKPMRRKISREDAEAGEMFLAKASAASGGESAQEPEISKVIACVLVAVCGAFAFGFHLGIVSSCGKG
ncbi:hypothetical protein DUNSADRAFT_11776 [Dunaliella salina]|uniref:Uncharacterized protein n=1 Tax=Dunaliella salina TaxID=3046 RepID=A0ABQ7GCM7_DUNSA|nr:hypothetical protein DUNSADRAFT_11776 [Dunaliella salina]|eukprot:KAF5832366.1 hypothetical protein DUNSADRAFT_11776 [Dunaliella salina]